ncbi:transportin-3 isoform X1 [Eurytemora carolleeae]|uniref:transportin-3 isoform X1 n=1 Tax=Eurytemora carolleeae TaxID=1294199 RepID=UPI000C79433D|nr:transportin-3 isoform X1 [Eurytemora carolleeae]|eukprot:XP_023333907.1 transportin-3-like isoform X1 [Eurytemora affinis]
MNINNVLCFHDQPGVRRRGLILTKGGMDTQPSVDLVVEAIKSLYNNPNHTLKEEAGRWLQQYQNSVYAWTVSDQLLQRKLDVETCYFAAQTLRSKIQSNFNELPTEVHESLRNSLLEHLRAITGTTDTVIRTQLCLAMADLILLMPEWKEAVPELMQKLSEPNQILTLLEVLMLLPEEVDSRHLRLGANRRQEVKEDLQKSSAAMSQLLQSCLNTSTDNSLTLQIMVLKCYSSWIILGVVPLNTMHSSSVLHLAIRVLTQHTSTQNIHEAASDCVINLLSRFEKESEPGLEQSMYETIIRLEDPYQLSVSEEDMEKCLNYCRIFTELGESFLLRMVSAPPSSPHFTIPILDTVLLCCSHPDYELPDVTFNLWYRLSEELYSRNDDSLVTVFKPYIERLIVCLSRHCQMEPDMVGCLSEDEDFAEFRTRVSDLIKDCIFIVGSSSVFRQMYSQLQQAQQWEQMEASLYVMQAVARNIFPDEEEVVPAVLHQVLALPFTLHQAVRVTAMRLVGELSEWIDRHPETLQAVLQHLLQGLQDPVLASDSATALESICAKCREQMTQHFTGLVQILEQIDKFNLKPDPAKGLVKGAALIVSIMPKDQLEGAVVKVCELQVSPLVAIMDAPRAPKLVKNSPSDPVLYLDRLADVFRHVSPSNGCVIPAPHPCKGVVEATWPALSRCCDLYADDERITERTCRTIRFAVRCLGIQSAGLLQPLVTQLIRLYESHNHSCYLYLGSILVDEYAGEPGCIPGLLQMVQAFIAPTYAILSKPDGLRNHPGTVDDFFRLNARFMQRAPLAYLQTEFLKSIVECGLLSTVLEHRVNCKITLVL